MICLRGAIGDVREAIGVGKIGSLRRNVEAFKDLAGLLVGVGAGLNSLAARKNVISAL